MNKLCRQVSIESPAGLNIKDCVFNFEVPVPDVPLNGARVRVVCAGACYRMRNRSPSASSISSVQSTEESYYSGNYGIRDGALFPGYEVSGIVDALGENVKSTEEIAVNKRVILYPYDGIPHGYAEYIVVNDLSFLVPIPDNLPLGIAAMLPSGALLAKNAVFTAHTYVTQLLKSRPANQICRVLIVGTGGLALWAIRIAQHHFKSPDCKDRVEITVASLKDEGFKLANELQKYFYITKFINFVYYYYFSVTLVQWNEEVHEKQLIDRTKDACNGLVDIVIDFGTTSRSLHRSLQCLNTVSIYSYKYKFHKSRIRIIRVLNNIVCFGL